MADRFIAVMSGNPDQVPAYLYSHTEIVARGTDPDSSRAALVLRTTDSERVDYLANYQADRLNSGLHGATVFETYDEAVERIRNRTAITVVRERGPVNSVTVNGPVNSVTVNGRADVTDWPVTPHTAPPTLAELRKLWLGAIAYASASERYDREVHFDAWAAEHNIT